METDRQILTASVAGVALLSNIDLGPSTVFAIVSRDSTAVPRSLVINQRAVSDPFREGICPNL